MTEKLYVVGHPVSHSKSPAMHNAAYEALGLDWSYGFADCLTEAEAEAFLGQRDWLAVNITTPYKPLALRMASWHYSDAQLAGGANVLVRRGDELLADNTDGNGCITYLRRCGVDFEGASLVVCGTGPTSLAIMRAAVQAGAAHVALLGRDEQRSQWVVERYRADTADSGSGEAAQIVGGSYSTCANLIEQAGVIVNATPLGMRHGDPAPFATELLSSGQVVFDVVYGQGETALIAAAHAAGCTAYDGEGMLVAQAVHTIRDIVDWLDVDVDIDSVDLFSIMAQAAGFAAV